MMVFMPRIELEHIEGRGNHTTPTPEGRQEVDDGSQSSTERFDRIAFAQRALALVGPGGTTIAICQGSRRIRVEAGRQWGAGLGQRWAILSIPADASRRAITSAILELGATARPWAPDVLIGGCESPYRGPGLP